MAKVVEDIGTLKINLLSQAQYDAEVQAGTVEPNELYLTPSSGSGILNLFYPVGSYYETSDTSFNPNTTWGGTWVLETEGLVHIGAGSNYAVGDTGGEAEHTLTVAEMPSHDGHVNATLSYGTAVGYFLTSTNMSAYGSYGRGWDTINGNEIVPHRENRGGGQPHNNMQPYIVVNRWHRTA